MTNTDLGIYGAKRQTWQGQGARALLKKLRDKNPDASVEELEELMHAKVQHDDDKLSEILTYWITRNMTSLEPPKSWTPQERKVREQEKANIAVAAKQIVKTEVIRLAISTIMPNGKMLGDCTGAYLVSLGGILAQIGKRAGKRKIKDVWANDELQALSP